MVSTASTNALPMNCPWRNKLSPSPRPRRGVHIVKVCPVDNIYLLCYTATCLSSIAGAGYSSPFPSHQGVHTRWFGRALDWQSRGQGFDPPRLHPSIELGSNASWGLFSYLTIDAMCWLGGILATYPLLITNMNVKNFTSLDGKASLQR